MKKSIIRLFSILLPAVLMISCTMLSASAAENARVNGVEIAVGEEFTYTFNISDADQKIAGMQMNLFFDQDALELVGVSDGVLNGTSTINDNQNKDGRITYINAFMNGGGLKCKDETVVATATFRVISAEDTDITYFIEYLYDINLVDIHSYTFTCDFLSRETVISQGNIPLLADKTIRDDLTGFDTFQNNEEGKGDGVKRDPAFEETQQIPTESRVPDKPEDTTAPKNEPSSESTASSESDKNENESRDKKRRSRDRDDNSQSFGVILIVVATVIGIVAVVAACFIIVKKLGNKNNS